MNAKLVIVLAAATMLAGSVRSFAADDSLAIATARDIPGKYVSGACAPFAENLYQRILSAGGEAHLVVFDWQCGSGTGTHAFVVYRDQQGRYWGMDNLQSHPIWLTGSTPKDWAEFFAPRYEVSVKIHRTDMALLGHYADLSHPTSRSEGTPSQMLATSE
jgi:hypothetical protein